MIVFLFPGHGAANIETAAYRSFPEARRLIELAGTFMDADPWRPDPGLFERTEHAQPLLTALTLGIHGALLSSGVRPGAVAGHSLGEIAAWSAAGCISPEEAVKLAALRGRLMAREAQRYPGGMLALLVDDPEPALALGRRHGVLQVAAHNAPCEWVVSGDQAALAAVAAQFHSVPLDVGGAWHGPVMEQAAEELGQALGAAPRRPPEVPFISNRDGGVARSGENLADLIAGQLVRRIEWMRTMKTLSDLGMTDAVTLGPGKILRGLVRKNLGGRVRVHSTQTPENMTRTMEALKS